ncbi:MAG: hypothetical protein ACHQF4_10360 [Sphingobacteriales bacterium]
MDKIFISNQIKMEILSICGYPTHKAYNLPGNLTLDIFSYGQNEELCRTLEQKLQEIASQYQTGKIILPGDVSKLHTVSDCIKMVFAHE